MNRFSFLLTFLVALGFAGDKDFNGRWNLTVEKEARGRAWWLEVEGAGSSKIKGRFVGAPGGQLDVIPEISIDHNELHWTFVRGNPRDAKAPQRKLVYTARFEKGKLIGNMSVDGKVENTFTGERSPEIRDREDGRWIAGKTEDLIAEKDLSNWEPTFPGKPLAWKVNGSSLVNEPNASDIRTKEKYWNFELHAEYRYEKGSNSGIGLRGRYEIQIMDTAGKPIDSHSHGGVYSRVLPTEQAALPPGEWQTMDIRLVGRVVTVKLNGKVIVDKKIIEGATAMSFDPNEADPGPIALQGDHGVVEFRKLTLTPLRRQ